MKTPTSIILGLLMLCIYSTNAQQIDLAKNGKPLATIVIPAKAPSCINSAALDLQKYVEKICGVKLPIQQDGKKVSGTGLYIGECEGSPACPLAKSGASWEGYVIETKEGNLYFTGLNPTPLGR